MARIRRRQARLCYLSIAPIALATLVSGLTLANHAPAAMVHNHAKTVSRKIQTGAKRRRNPKAKASVVGGEPAAAGSFPFMAFVVAKEPDGLEGACSGTVVSSNVILTAAHCVTADEGTVVLEPSAFAVVTGTVDWATPPREISAVSAVLPDPSYQATGPFGGWHDDALLELAAPISAPPVRLASTAFWTPGTPATIAGWGLTEGDGAEIPTELQWGSTVVQSEQFCKAEGGALFHPLAELCTIDAPTYQSATCNGDSGGPLLAIQPGTSESVEIGVTDYAIEEGCPTTSPRFDTRADVIAAWVNRRIVALAPRPAPTPPSPPRSPTPAPSSAIPPSKPTLPFLSRGQALARANSVLTERFGRLFRFRRRYMTICDRRGTSKYRCSIRWEDPNWKPLPSFFRGGFTVYYESKGSAPALLRIKARILRHQCASKWDDCTIRVVSVAE